MTLSQDDQQEIRQRIGFTPDKDLDVVSKALIRKYAVTHPVIHLDQRTVSINSEELYTWSAPPGVAFTPGKPKEVAVYTFPISGTVEIARQVLSPIMDRYYFSIASTPDLFYKEFADNISTDPQVQQRVAQNVLAKINTAQQLLSGAKPQTDQENIDRQSFIEQAVQQERQKRDQNNQATRSIDPFS